MSFVEQAMEAEMNDTRARLLQIARSHFAAFGFENTTMRKVASEADVDAAMIIRYFGNKETLFAEAASLELSLPNLNALPRDRVGEEIIRHFMRRWEGSQSDDLLQVLIRCAATNEAAANRMRDIFREQVATMVAAIAPSDEVDRRAGLVASQILGLAFCRYVLALRQPDLSDDALLSALGGTIQRYLFSLLRPE